MRTTENSNIFAAGVVLQFTAEGAKPIRHSDIERRGFGVLNEIQI